jgi:UDP-N-acetylglucosamine acyltransferase
VVLEGPTRIGRRNRIYQFASLGGPPQDKKYAGEPTRLEIGDGNLIRECCTFNRGTVQGGGTTRIGDRNWIMAYVHVAHDCVVGSDTILANCATLAGHVVLEDRATLGAFTVVHQFCKIGRHAFTAMGTVVLKDIPPYVTASGNSAKPHGINAEGLRRAGFDTEQIRRLREAYKTVYKRGLTVEQALAELGRLEAQEVRPLIDFIRASARGIVR